MLHVVFDCYQSSLDIVFFSQFFSVTLGHMIAIWSTLQLYRIRYFLYLDYLQQ